MSQLRIVLIKWWFSNTWVHLTVFDMVTLVHGYEQYNTGWSPVGRTKSEKLRNDVAVIAICMVSLGVYSGPRQSAVRILRMFVHYTEVGVCVCVCVQNIISFQKRHMKLLESRQDRNNGQ